MSRGGTPERERVRGGVSSILPRKKQNKQTFPHCGPVLPCKEHSPVLCLCFRAPPHTSLPPLNLPYSPCTWVSITADLAGSSPQHNSRALMPWAPWHKAVQLISQAWLCPLLPFEKLLEKQVSGVGVHGAVLSACSKCLHCGNRSHISCKKETKKKNFIPHALFSASL